MSEPERIMLDPGIIDPEPWPCECQSDGLPADRDWSRIVAVLCVLALVAIAFAAGAGR